MFLGWSRKNFIRTVGAHCKCSWAGVGRTSYILLVSGIRYQVSYLDWGTCSHRLFLQAPSKKKGKEKSTKQRQRSVKCESIGSSIVL